MSFWNSIFVWTYLLSIHIDFVKNVKNLNTFYSIMGYMIWSGHIFNFLKEIPQIYVFKVSREGIAHRLPCHWAKTEDYLFRPGKAKYSSQHDFCLFSFNLSSIPRGFPTYFQISDHSHQYRPQQNFKTMTTLGTNIQQNHEIYEEESTFQKRKRSFKTFGFFSAFA